MRRTALTPASRSRRSARRSRNARCSAPFPKSASLGSASVGSDSTRRSRRSSRKFGNRFNLNTASQVAATLALTDLAPILEEHVTAVVAERQRLAAELEQHDSLSCYPSDANFLLVEFGGEVPELCAALLEWGIAVRQFAAGPQRLRSCIRITIGTPEENERLLEALGDILG